MDSTKINSKAISKNPVIPAPCWPEGVGSWCCFQNSLFNMMHGSVTSPYRSTDGRTWWEARCGLSSMLSKRLFLCAFSNLSKKTGQYQIYFPHFPLRALDEDVVLCNRCEEGGILGLRSSPFLAPSPRADASRQTVREARRLKMGTICFATDCGHNLTRTQSIRQHPADPVEWQMRLRLLITLGNSHATQSHAHRRLARSSFWHGVSLTTE